jgi:hypothetical protein
MSSGGGRVGRKYFVIKKPLSVLLRGFFEAGYLFQYSIFVFTIYDF